jgi:hypothetical protein
MRRNPPKVPRTRQSNMDKPLQKLIHTCAAQGHFDADGHALTELEARHILPGKRNDGFLPCNERQLLYRLLQEFLIRYSRPYTPGNYDFSRRGTCMTFL